MLQRSKDNSIFNINTFSTRICQLRLEPPPTISLEKVQWRAARWVPSEYNSMSSVTHLLDQLNWKSLQSRRSVSRLTLLYKVLHQDLPSIKLPLHYKSTEYPTRLLHHYRYISPGLQPKQPLTNRATFLERSSSGITSQTLLLKQKL